MMPHYFVVSTLKPRITALIGLVFSVHTRPADTMVEVHSKSAIFGCSSKKWRSPTLHCLNTVCSLCGESGKSQTLGRESRFRLIADKL